MLPRQLDSLTSVVQIGRTVECHHGMNEIQAAEADALRAQSSGDRLGLVQK